MVTSSASGRTATRGPAASCSSAAISIARSCAGVLKGASRIELCRDEPNADISYRDRISMSQTKKADFLIESRGVHRLLDAFVVAARFSRDGRTLAFAMGDGTTRFISVADPAAEWRPVSVHDGAILSFAADANAGGFISGGDDGNLRSLSASGEVSDVASFGMKWIEQLASHALDKGKGL